MAGGPGSASFIRLQSGDGWDSREVERWAGHPFCSCGPSVGRLVLPPSVEAQSGQGASTAAQSSKWVSQESQVEEALYEVPEWHVCHSHKPTQIPGKDTQIPSLDGNSVRVTSWAGHVRWEMMFQLTWGDPLWLRWGAGVNR